MGPFGRRHRPGADNLYSVFGISGTELIILAIITFVVIGRPTPPPPSPPRVLVGPPAPSDAAGRAGAAKAREEALLKEQEKAESHSLPRGAYAPFDVDAT